MAIPGDNQVIFTFLGDVAGLKSSTSAAKSEIDALTRYQSASFSGGGTKNVIDTTDGIKRSIKPLTEVIELFGKFTLVVGAAVGIHKALVAGLEAAVKWWYSDKIAIAENVNTLNKYNDALKQLTETERERRQREISEKFDKLTDSVIRDESITDEDQRQALLSRIQNAADNERAKAGIEAERKKRAAIDRLAREQREKQHADEMTELEASKKLREDAERSVSSFTASREEEIAAKRVELYRQIEIAFNRQSETARVDQLKRLVDIETEKTLLEERNRLQKEANDKQREADRERLAGLDKVLQREERIRDLLREQSEYRFDVSALGVSDEVSINSETRSVAGVSFE